MYEMDEALFMDRVVYLCSKGFGFGHASRFAKCADHRVNGRCRAASAFVELLLFRDSGPSWCPRRFLGGGERELRCIGLSKCVVPSKAL